jgi:ubiquinone/menaquinone biosynthesis C-methylase UbiE
VPKADVGVAKVGITDQFLAEAQTYQTRSLSTPYWSWLIRQATEGHFVEPPSMILDIGSGSGNSVVPCLVLFPKARIVATDLSESLLAILRTTLAGYPDAPRRTALVCLDATRAEFIEESVDLVVGAAILHHLIDPALCVKRVCRALRPGGLAVFFEPFEAGNVILRIAYERILAEDAIRETEHLSATTAHTLRALIYDFRVRAGSNKSAEIFRQIDDKWLFTRGYFNNMVTEIAGVTLEVEPLPASDDVFVAKTRTYLKQVKGFADEEVHSTLPGWAWDIVRSVDAAVSPELKRDLPIEARVMFRRTR